MRRKVNTGAGLAAGLCLAGLLIVARAGQGAAGKAAPPRDIRPVNTLHAAFRGGLIRTVVALGDSTTEGYGLPEGWPQILGRDLAQRFSGMRVVNAGRAGDTAADGLARLERDVLAHRPNLVLVSFGLNEARKGVPAGKFRGDLLTLVRRLRKAGSRIALLTTTRPALGTAYLYDINPAPYNRVTREVAAAEGLLLVDVWRDSEGLNRKEYLLDLVHPNARGQRELARIIADGLLK